MSRQLAVHGRTPINAHSCHDLHRSCNDCPLDLYVPRRNQPVHRRITRAVPRPADEVRKALTLQTSHVLEYYEAPQGEYTRCAKDLPAVTCHQVTSPWHQAGDVRAAYRYTSYTERHLNTALDAAAAAAGALRGQDGTSPAAIAAAAANSNVSTAAAYSPSNEALGNQPAQFTGAAAAAVGRPAPPAKSAAAASHGSKKRSREQPTAAAAAWGPSAAPGSPVLPSISCSDEEWGAAGDAAFSEEALQVLLQAPTPKRQRCAAAAPEAAAPHHQQQQHLDGYHPDQQPLRQAAPSCSPVASWALNNATAGRGSTSPALA